MPYHKEYENSNLIVLVSYLIPYEMVLKHYNFMTVIAMSDYQIPLKCID